jgi:hypothetical protein
LVRQTAELQRKGHSGKIRLENTLSPGIVGFFNRATRRTMPALVAKHRFAIRASRMIAPLPAQNFHR